MDLKKLLRRIEVPFLYVFAALWLIIYILSGTVLEMATYDSPKRFLLWVAVGILPIAVYAALRIMFSEREKWYAAIGYMLGIMLLGTFTVEFMLVNGEILMSTGLRPSEQKELKLLEVRKVFKRKLGFDHTAVTVLRDGNQVVMEARPYAYFYLEGRPGVAGRIGKSWLGNT